MSEGGRHKQGVAFASSNVAGTPRARGCDTSKVPECRAPKVRVPDHIRRESHTCMGSADTELINHNALLHGFDRSQVAHIEVFVSGRGGGGDGYGFLQQWGRDISPGIWRVFREAAVCDKCDYDSGDVHIYLVAKLFRTLTRMKNVDWYGNKCMEVGPTCCMTCFAYTDGTSDSTLRQWLKYRWLVDAPTHCAAFAPYGPTKEKDRPWMK
ncbi:hypothetical protein N9L68_07990, partial [bacterium]|nr:hypothetical protein [bacterium]